MYMGQEPFPYGHLATTKGQKKRPRRSRGAEWLFTTPLPVGEKILWLPGGFRFGTLRSDCGTLLRMLLFLHDLPAAQISQIILVGQVISR